MKRRQHCRVPTYHSQHYPPQLQVRRGDAEEGRGRQGGGTGCAVNSHMEIYLQHIRMLSAFRSIFNRVRSPCGLSGFPKRLSQCVCVSVCVSEYECECECFVSTSPPPTLLLPIGLVCPSTNLA